MVTEKRTYVSFIVFLLFLNIIPWAFEYLDFPHYVLGHAPSPFDWFKTGFESSLIFIISFLYAIFSSMKFKEVRTQWQFLNNALTAMPEAIFTIDMDGNIIYMNGACSILIKKNVEDIVGKCGVGEVFGKEVESILKETSNTFRLITGIEANVPCGDDLVSCLVSSSALKTPRGGVIGYVLILRDMSAEKRLHAKLINMERLASLGQVSASVTHELNQPLNVIMMSCTNLLLQLESGELPEKDEINDSLIRIKEQAERASKITDQVLTHAKDYKTGVEEIDINSIINGVLALVEPQMRAEDFDITTKLTDKISNVRVDKGQLEQVFFNIIQNARDAMNSASKRNEDLRKELEIASFGERDSVAITFKDTGGGIPEKVMEKIFTPFFTTKESGTGLGLGICKEIIESFGGTIDFEVEEGKGTTFKLKFPKVQESP